MAGTRNLLKQDFEAVTDPASIGWGSPNLASGMSIYGDQWGNYFQFSLGNNNGRNCYCLWGSDLYTDNIPDGTYHMSRKNKATGKTQVARMDVMGGRFVVPAGTVVTLQEGAGLSAGVKQLRDLYVDENGASTEDVEFSSPSSAGSFVIGASCNGWDTWKDAGGKPMSAFRQEDD
jgi:hypothetical protein